MNIYEKCEGKLIDYINKYISISAANIIIIIIIILFV
jgi:hypothetical protein